MEELKFTKPELEKLKPRDKRYEVRDTEQPKLLLRVSPSGVKSFVMYAKLDGRAERVTIGRFEERGVTIDTARRTVSKWINEYAARAGNPAAERRTMKEQMTLGELWEEYLSKHAKPNKRSWRIDECQYKKHLKKWKNRQLGNIRKADVTRLAATVERNGGPVARNRVLALLSSMWGWAQRERGLSLANPTTGVPRVKEQPRERYLLPAELRRLYAVLEADTGQASGALLLLLLTGQRKSTICGLRWSEVDFRDAVLKIPSERMKAGRDHTVPLAGAALDILKARRAAAKPRARYVFPTWSKRNHLYDLRRPFTRMLEEAEIEGRCTPHDLRRTWATYCRELGRDPAPILGHAPQGVTERHYSMNTIAALRATMRATVNHIVKTATSDTGNVVAFLGGEG